MDIDKMVANCIRWEGAVPWMYRDTLGYCTAGVGWLIHGADDAAAMPFILGGRPASADEKRAEFWRVMALPKGLSADAYKGALSLSQETVQATTRSRLMNEFIPGVSRAVDKFYALPEPAQDALVDIAFNVGVHGFAEFRKLIAAVERGDFYRVGEDGKPVPGCAAAECTVSTSRPDRNQWRQTAFIAASAPPS